MESVSYKYSESPMPNLSEHFLVEFYEVRIQWKIKTSMKFSAIVTYGIHGIKFKMYIGWNVISRFVEKITTIDI